MAEQTFKSPNFYDREIDLSAPSITGPVGVPATVIGTSNKGPAFVPVTVANFDEFNQVFGGLDTNHFGTYGSNEFLKHRSALTYLRVLGAGSEQADEYGSVKNAGFYLSGSVQANPGTDNRNLGVVQFLTAEHDISNTSHASMPTLWDNDTIDGSSTVNLVRGVIMTTSTSRIRVLTPGDALTDIISPAGGLDSATVNSDSKFVIIISSSLGNSFSSDGGNSGLRILTASFDPSDKDYFGKVLNTDPDKFYQEQHYLHADFAVDPNVASVVSGNPVAVLSGSTNSSADGKPGLYYREIFGSYNTRFRAPQTSFFISQPFGSTEYDLFKFESLDDGEYANSLYKISITNIKASVDESNKYGTFTVQVRSWDDSDTSLNIIEQFSNCSLDPNSENYVAKLIGDRKVYYNFDALNESEKRIVATGNYPNNSAYIRIIMNDAVVNGSIPKEALPFGFRGPELLSTSPVTKISDAVNSSNTKLSGQLDAGASNLSGSIVPPVPYRYKVTRGSVSDTPSYDGDPGSSENTNVAYYWGTMFERASASSKKESVEVLNANVNKEKNSIIESFTKFMGLSGLGALSNRSESDLMHNNKFSLAKVALNCSTSSQLTSSINNHMKDAVYVRNAILDTTDYTWNEVGNGKRLTFASLLSSEKPELFNKFSSYAKFTNFMYGGFDGTNMLNRDARRLNDKSLSLDSNGDANPSYVPEGFVSNPSGTGISNNGISSYLTAVNIATNPLEMNTNIVAIPGIREPYITDKTMQSVRDYGLAMYVMDVPSYDDGNIRMYDSSLAKPHVGNTITQFDNRSIDNNYTAVYYPDIFIDDLSNKRKVKVPASVAALGALAYNDRVTYPWFAPAGFNRAALDFVTNVSVRLNGSDRDSLYESRINPIATFPRLGYVIYGQKTLQINKSALDRVNVRRLMLEIKRLISTIAQQMVFEQNTPSVRNKFVADASFQLGLIQAQAGIETFQVVMNESNNTREDVDLNRLNGRIVVVPTRVVEYIAIDFVITNSGVSFQ